jgi:hypothetical protein
MQIICHHVIQQKIPTLYCQCLAEFRFTIQETQLSLLCHRPYERNLKLHILNVVITTIDNDVIHCSLVKHEHQKSHKL